MRLTLFTIFLSLSMIFPAAALESAPAKAEFSRIKLLTGALHPASETTPATLDAAVEVSLDKGWKTYWRSAGDAGFPMNVALEPTSTNVESPVIHWPHSTRFVEEWGLEVFGFKDNVTIPVSFTVPDAAQPSRIDLRVSYAVCSDICINQDHHVSLELPAGFVPDAQHVKRIAKAKEAIPAANGTNGLEVQSIRVESEDTATNKGMLLVEAQLPAGKASKADVFIEGPAGFRFPDPAVTWKGKSAVFKVAYEISVPAKSLYGIPLVLTLVQGGKAVEAALTVPVKETAAESSPEEVQVADAEKSLWARLQKRFMPENSAN